MKALLVALQAGIALVLAIVAVHRLANPVPAGERLIARATIEQIADSVIVARGMRVVAVPVNRVAGFALSGMHVDVLISGRPGTGTRTLLQIVMVLSARQELARDAEGKSATVKVVNLLATQEQAEHLSLASRQTTIQFGLHNPLDRARW
jgi:Flp pilus assembly protein CpaB